MTREERTETVVCPVCENNPIIWDDELYFCDCCNEDFTRGELAPVN